MRRLLARGSVKGSPQLSPSPLCDTIRDPADLHRSQGPWPADGAIDATSPRARRRHRQHYLQCGERISHRPFHGGSLRVGRAARRDLRPLRSFVAAGTLRATDYRLAPEPVAGDAERRRRGEVSRTTSPRAAATRRACSCSHGWFLAASRGESILGTVGLVPGDLAGIIAMGCTLAPLEDVTSRLTMEQLRERWPRSSDVKTFASLDERLDSDPSRFIGPHMPPTIVVVAAAERFFPSILEQGAKFVRRLLEMKRPADVIIVPGRHMTSIQNISVAGDPTFAAIRKFIAQPGTAGESLRWREGWNGGARAARDRRRRQAG